MARGHAGKLSHEMLSSETVDLLHDTLTNATTRHRQYYCTRGLHPLLLDPRPPGILQDVCLAGDVLAVALKEGLWLYTRSSCQQKDSVVGARWVLKEKREESCFRLAYRCQSLDPFFVSRGYADASRFFRYVCVASGNSSIGYSISVTSTASRFVHHHELHGEHRILSFAVAPITAAGSFVFHQCPLVVSIDDHGGIIFFDIERNVAQRLLCSSSGGVKREKVTLSRVTKNEVEGTPQGIKLYHCSGGVPIQLVVHGSCTDPSCPWCKGKEKGSSCTRRGIPLTVHVVQLVKPNETSVRCFPQKSASTRDATALHSGISARSDFETPTEDIETNAHISARNGATEDLAFDSEWEITQLQVLWSVNQALLVNSTVIYREKVKHERIERKRSKHPTVFFKKTSHAVYDRHEFKSHWSRRMRVPSFCVSLVAAEEGRFILQVATAETSNRFQFFHGCTGKSYGRSAPLVPTRPNSDILDFPMTEESSGEVKEDGIQNQQVQSKHQQMYFTAWIPIGCQQIKEKPLISSSLLDVSLALTSTGKLFLIGARNESVEGSSTYKQLADAEKKEIDDWLKEDEGNGELCRREETEETLVGLHPSSERNSLGEKKDYQSISYQTENISGGRKVPEYSVVLEIMDLMKWLEFHAGMYFGLLKKKDFLRQGFISKVLQRITVDTVWKQVHFHMFGGECFLGTLLSEVESGLKATRAQPQSSHSSHNGFNSFSSFMPSAVDLLSSRRNDRHERNGATRAVAQSDASLFSWGIARTLGSALLQSFHSSNYPLIKDEKVTSTILHKSTREEQQHESYSLKQRPSEGSAWSRNPTATASHPNILCIGLMNNKDVGGVFVSPQCFSHLFIAVRSFKQCSRRKETFNQPYRVTAPPSYKREKVEGGQKKVKECITNDESWSDSCREEKLLGMSVESGKKSIAPLSSSEMQHRDWRRAILPHTLCTRGILLWQLQYGQEPSMRQNIKRNYQSKIDALWVIFKKDENNLHYSLLLSRASERKKREWGSDNRSKKSFLSSSIPMPAEKTGLFCWGTVNNLLEKNGTVSPLFYATLRQSNGARGSHHHSIAYSQLKDEHEYLKSFLEAAHEGSKASTIAVPSHILALQERDRLSFEVQDLILRHREELKAFRDPHERVVLFELQERKVLHKKERDLLDPPLSLLSTPEVSTNWKRHPRTPFLHPEGHSVSLEQWQKYADGCSKQSEWVWSVEELSTAENQRFRSCQVENRKRITIAGDLLGWSLGPWMYEASKVECNLSTVINEELWSPRETESCTRRLRKIYRDRIHRNSYQKLEEKRKSQVEELRALRAVLSLS